MRVPALANLRDQAGQAVDLVVVDAVGRLSHVGAGADLAGQCCEGDVVAREARAAIAHGALQVLRADARVGAQRLGHGIDVGARQAVADVGQHVGVGDLGRDVGVDRDLGELGVDEVHALHRRLVLAHLQVDGLQHVAGLGVALADQDRIGIEHVAHHAAQRDELGIVAEAEIGPDLAARRRFERRLDLAAGGAGHHRAGDDHHVVALLVAQRLAERLHRLQHEAVGEEAGAVRRRRHDHEAGVALLDRFAGIHGRRQALLVGGDQLVELRLDDRHLAGIQRIDQHLADVEADHGEAAAGEHRGKRRSKLAEADYRHARESC